MKAILGTLLAITALLTPTVSSSTELDDGDIVIWGDQVDTLLQMPGETTEQFTVRAFQRFRLFTKETGFEASGNLCKDKQGRMGITLVTWHAHFSSPYLGGCPLDTPIKGDFVHSHPMAGRYTMTKQDVIDANQRGRFFKLKKAKSVFVSRASAQSFSPPDYAIGPGYLVSDDVVLYQQGRGTARVVMRLPPLPATTT